MENTHLYKDRLFLAKAALLAATYFAVGKFGLTLAYMHASVTAVWPPTGLALAALLLGGRAYWPAILVGAFVVNATTPESLLTCFLIAIGNTLEALVGSYLIEKLAGGRKVFHRVRDVFKFLLIAAAISTPLSATWGAGSLFLMGSLEGLNPKHIWLTWWLGDLMGALAVTPVVILWAEKRQPWKLVRIPELLAVIGILLILIWGNFGDLFSPAKRYPINFICIPPLLWLAYRFGSREAMTATFVLSFFSILGTLQGFGSFSNYPATESLLLLQTYMGVVSVTVLIFSAVVWERSRVEDTLRQTQEGLEYTVRERTSSLSHLIEVLQDEIGQHEETEHALRASENRFRTLLEAAPDIIFFISPEARFVMLNGAFERTLGWPVSEWLGKEFTPLVHPDDLGFVMGQFMKVAAGKDIDSLEARVLTKDGNYLVFEVTSRPQEEHGKVIGVLGIARDITQRKQTERTISEKQKELVRSAAEREQLELFASVAAHDLQEPLQKIVTFGDLLKIECGDSLNKAGLNYLGRLQNSSKKLHELIVDLLKFSKAVSQKSSADVVKLDQVLKEIMTDLELRIQESDAQISLGKMPVLYASRVQLRELFHNLISNAIKFRKKDVSPKITVRSKTLPDGGVEISVQDNGIGFDEKFSERIFRPFERLHRNSEYAGSGVGLAICQRIVSRLGGKITVRSVLGEGTAFTITFPQALREKGGAELAAEPNR